MKHLNDPSCNMKKFRVWDGEKMVYPETITLGINPWNGLFSAENPNLFNSGLSY